MDCQPFKMDSSCDKKQGMQKIGCWEKQRQMKFPEAVSWAEKALLRGESVRGASHHPVLMGYC